MAKLENLIANLSRQGERRGGGSFTLDPARAREKLREYQLSDPHRYVLLLVQAATALGAERIEFEIDADDMWMRFDARFLEPGDIAGLFDALFADAADSGTRGRQTLAFGLNAALALSPRFVRVRSGTQRFEFGTEGIVQVESHDGDVAFTHEIHVKDRPSPQVFVEFFKDLRGQIAEEVVLREACRWSRVPIWLDGTPISKPLRLPTEETWLRRDVSWGQATGQVGIGSGLAPALVTISCSGVVLLHEALPGAPPGFLALVDAPHLGRDVSQTQIVRDERFVQLMIGLRRAAASLLDDVARAWLGERVQDWSGPASLREAPRPLVEALRWAATRRDAPKHVGRLPLWPRLDELPETMERLRLQEEVRYVTGRASQELPEGFGDVLLLQDSSLPDLLREALGKRLRDVTATYERALERLARRRAFEARTMAPRLPEGAYRVRTAISGDGLRGELGIRITQMASASLSFIVDGCLLYCAEADVGIPGLVAVVEAGLTPSVDYDGAHRNDVLDATVRAIADALELSMRALAERVDEPADARVVADYLAASFDGELCVRLMEAAGFEEQAIGRRLSTWPRGALPGWWGDEANPLWTASVLSMASGSNVSVAQLRRDAQAGGTLEWLPKEAFANVEVEGSVLLLMPREHALVRAVVGEAAMRSFEAKLASAQVRKARHALPPSPLALKIPSRVRALRFERPELRGVVGVGPVRASQLEHGSPARVRVLFDERPLTELSFECPIPAVVATVDSQTLGVDEAITRLTDAGMAVLHRELQSAVAELVLDVASSLSGRDVPGNVVERTTLLAASLCVFADAEHFSAFLGELESGSLQSAIEQLTRGQRARSSMPQLLEAVLAEVKAIWATPCFVSGQSPTSFLAVLDDLAAHGDLAWVPEHRASDLETVETDRRIVVLDPPALTLLRRVFDPSCLTDAQPWIDAWRQRKSFRERPELEAIELPSDAAVVKVRVDADGFRGEVGFGPSLFASPGELRVTVCHQRRVLEETFWVDALARVALLDHDQVGAARNFRGLDEDERESIRRVCDAAASALLEEFANRVPALVKTRRVWVRSWVVGCLSHASGGRRLRPAAIDAPAARLLDLPLFDDLEGRCWSIRELADAHRVGDAPVFAVDLASAGAPEARARVVIAVTPGELEMLDPLLGGVMKLSDVLEVEREREARRARAKNLPAMPSHAFASMEVTGRGLRGTLWVCRDETPEVVLGLEGREVERISLSEIFTVGGAIEVPPGCVDESWSTVTLSKGRRDYLRSKARDLYIELVDGVVQALEEPEERPAAGWKERIGRTVGELFSRDDPRDAVRALAVRMLQERRASGRWSDGPTRRLFRRVVHLPLFEIEGGRFVSLKVAQREHPRVLRGTGLWDEATHAALVAARPPRPPKPRRPKPPPVRPEPPSTTADDARTREESTTVGQPDPESRLLEVVRDELKLLRPARTGLLCEAHLEQLSMGELRGPRLIGVVANGVVISRRHPVVERLLESETFEPFLVSLVVSSAFTGLNLLHEAITDEHEVLFHRLHLESWKSRRRSRP